MTIEEMKSLFEKHDDEEYLKFNRIKKPLHATPDICAFLLLDDISPSTYRSGERCDIISTSEHDQYWLATDVTDFASKATEQDIITLLRCGISYDQDAESFYSFT